MKKMKKIFFIFVIIIGLLYGEEKFDGLKEPVRSNVYKTFSVDVNKRTLGAYNLSEIKNSRSVSFLILLLDDEEFTWCKYDGKGVWTSPAKEAIEAIIKIGKPSLEYIFQVLEDKHPYIELNKTIEKNLIYVLKKITNKNFEAREEWINWWNK
ncbi:MAG TPA: hypothetical protein P5150_07145, partial [Candidatus Ratteibacteria bacterium]|nr:hypothetical protein [Candidatus Ratteibacteria bacterium]